MAFLLRASNARCGMLLVFLAVFAITGRACVLVEVGRNKDTPCSPSNCSKLTGYYQTPSAGWLTVTGVSSPPRGGMNYEFFNELAPSKTYKDGTTTKYYYSFLSQVQAASFTECCRSCAQTTGCYLWRHFPQTDTDRPSGMASPYNSWSAKYLPPFPTCQLGTGCGTYNSYPNYATSPPATVLNCVLFALNNKIRYTSTGQTCTGTDANGCYAALPVIDTSTATSSGRRADGVGYATSFSNNLISALNTDCHQKPRSFAGGLCNPNDVPGTVNDDPHFLGKDGVRFDFNGEIGKTFCLISDHNIQVNMVLDGYSNQLKGGNPEKALRSWITGISFLWRDDEGKKHNIFLEARKGFTQAREDGFVSSIKADGQPVDIPKELGDVVNFHGAKLVMVEQKKRGAQDMDVLTVVIKDVLEGKLSMRVAHPLLQTATEAYAHFNLQVTNLAATSHIHGVLGQTFRHDSTRVMKVLEYKMLSALLRDEPMRADGTSGTGYLDGEVKDYITSGPTEADCKFCTPFDFAVK